MFRRVAHVSGETWGFWFAIELGDRSELGQWHGLVECDEGMVHGESFGWYGGWGGVVRHVVRANLRCGKRRGRGFRMRDHRVRVLSSLKALLSTDNDPAERVVPSHLFALEGAWSYSQGVSHSFCDPREGDHDIVALTPCWSDLDPTLDLDTFLCAAARGTPPRPDAAPPLLSLWHVPSALAAGRTTG